MAGWIAAPTRSPQPRPAGVREHSHETLFWQAVAHLKLDPEGLVAHYLGRRTGATIAAENGATDRELMANGGWTTPAMLVRYVDPRRKIELARSALAKMP